MPIDPGDFTNADGAFQEQIENEMQRVTNNLNRITTLLKAGLAHPQALKEFRESRRRMLNARWAYQLFASLAISSCREVLSASLISLKANPIPTPGCETRSSAWVWIVTPSILSNSKAFVPTGRAVDSST